MKITSAAFETSAAKPGQYPEAVLPEIAFAGRSNVGKSSLINTLLNRRHLVKTSSTPGKTRLINFFVINNAFYFVDLPGYGYARVSQKERKKWGPMVETYLSSRPNLRAVVLLQDIRRMPGSEEIQLLEFLEHLHLPVLVILTKADKFSKNKQGIQARQIRQHLKLNQDETVLFSAKTRQGMDKIHEMLGDLLREEPTQGPVL
ncbi:MAG: ribosome biogenesis GTP-binding protein YihA/YsxC [Desulfosalsimonas sp.]|uniref:ribosome biogenesis GTP-binding protein YihA/YsxC n=1 Tax=Desulfosalsimonas sp. TaxID=3073848 RepID=UPI003970AB00